MEVINTRIDNINDLLNVFIEQEANKLVREKIKEQNRNKFRKYVNKHHDEWNSYMRKRYHEKKQKIKEMNETASTEKILGNFRL